MPPDFLLTARLPYALDHGIVVECVRQQQTVREQLGDSGNAGFVRYVARGEHERGRFVVEFGKLALELDKRMVGARDISRSAGAGAHAGGRFDHRADHLRMLSHSEVVVGAPDRDIARALRGMPDRVRESAGYALKIRKHPVPSFIPQPVEGRREITLIIHVFYFPDPRLTF